jgi:hypothetical protein
MRNTIVGQTSEPHRSTPARTGGNSMFAAMRHRNFSTLFWRTISLEHRHVDADHRAGLGGVSDRSHRS